MLVDQLIGHDDCNYDVVLEYRFNRACGLLGLMGYIVSEKEDGSVQVSRMHTIRNKLVVSEPIRIFSDRAPFLLVTETAIESFLFTESKTGRFDEMFLPHMGHLSDV